LLGLRRHRVLGVQARASGLGAIKSTTSGKKGLQGAIGTAILADSTPRQARDEVIRVMETE